MKKLLLILLVAMTATAYAQTTHTTNACGTINEWCFYKNPNQFTPVKAISIAMLDQNNSQLYMGLYIDKGVLDNGFVLTYQDHLTAGFENIRRDQEHPRRKMESIGFIFDNDADPIVINFEEDDRAINASKLPDYAAEWLLEQIADGNKLSIKLNYDTYVWNTTTYQNEYSESKSAYFVISLKGTSAMVNKMD